MANHRAAEFVLRRVTSRERAAEVVGDLTEQQASPAMVWRTVLRLVFSSTWRWIPAVALAPILMIASITPGITFGLKPYAELHRDALVTLWPTSVAAWLFVLSMLLGAGTGGVFGLAVVRYGVLSRLALSSLSVSLLLMVVSCLAFDPYAIVYAPVVLLAALGFALRNARLRRLLPAVLVTMSSFFVGVAVLSGIYLAMEKLGVARAEVSSASILLCFLLEAAVLSRMERWSRFDATRV